MSHRVEQRSWYALLLLCAVLLIHVRAAAAQPTPNAEQKLVMVAKPSVVRVFGVYLATFRFNDEDWEEAIGGTGSGFFITADGYIATNAHVVQNISEGEEKAKAALIRELSKEIYAKFGDELDRMTATQRADILDTIKLTSIKKLSYVVLPNGDKLDYEIKAYGEPGKGRDAAIIKVNTANAPILLVGDSNKSQVADRIVVLGYPGVADFRGLLDEKSQLEASVTEGSIAALKRAASGEPILQISAPITHGNSGGPAINEQGEVIGLATFGNEGEVQGFNFLVASATLLDYVKQIKLDPKPSATNTLWKAGLDLYWDRQYSLAIAKFEQVSKQFPAHSEAANVIAMARGFQKDGKERKVEKSNNGAIVGGVLGGLAFFAVLVWLMRRKSHAGAKPAVAAAPGGPNAGWQAGVPAPMPPAMPPGFAPGTPPRSPYAPPPGGAPPAWQQPSGPTPGAPQVPIAKTVAINGPMQHAPVAATAFGAMAIGNITCVRGLLQGQRFALTPQGLLIGRQPGVAQIVVNDGRASGKHVWIGLENGKIVCVDQGTTNGTFVNDINHGRISKVELRDGDVVIVAEPDVLSLQLKFS
ncbi:MAG TPA: trypsin-like peptidase domain-containing protein [Kofleriaceae bacterium]|nr:trypsin-like peptidase domain-containing protein [Kofleriaceae bacterium]